MQQLPDWLCRSKSQNHRINVILEVTQMKAIVFTKYCPADVPQLKDVAKPVPKDNQVLVKVHAASANALAWRRFTMTSILGHFVDGVLLKVIHTVLGADIAGRGEAGGAIVKQFQPGDGVFGVSAGSVGAFAEDAFGAEEQVALKPGNLSFGAAAAVPVARTT